MLQEIYFEKALLFIAKNYTNTLTLDQIAKEVGLSKFHFHRLFKLQSKESVNAYIHRLRMENTVHLFRMYPALNNIEISFQCGYNSPSEFSRVFKKHYKCSPREFRQRQGIIQKFDFKEKNQQLPVVYFPKIKLKVKSSFFIKNKLDALLKIITDENQHNSPIFGVYIDAPLHITPDKCRYFAGIESNEKHPLTINYELEEGYYTFLDFQGNNEELIEKIMNFKTHQIDPSPYEISSFIAFEKIEIGQTDYFKAKRMIYIKIRKK